MAIIQPIRVAHHALSSDVFDHNSHKRGGSCQIIPGERKSAIHLVFKIRIKQQTVEQRGKISKAELIGQKDLGLVLIVGSC